MGQTLTGQRACNREQEAHGEPPLELSACIGTGHWRQATFEDWQSELLQMGSYVLLPVWLRQKGSAESKPFEGETPVCLRQKGSPEHMPLAENAA